MRQNGGRQFHRADRSGTTMVEVLVAIVVVLLMTVTFSKVVSVSVHFLSRSRQIIQDTENFNERYYTLEAYEQRMPVEEKLTLVLDEGRTDLARNKAASGVRLNLNSSGKMVYWAASDTGYKMYSLQSGTYAAAEPTPAPTPTSAPTPAPTANPTGGGPIDVLGDNIVGVHPIDFTDTKETFYYNKVVPKGIYWEYDASGNMVYYVVTDDLNIPSYFYQEYKTDEEMIATLLLSNSIQEYTLQCFPIDLTKLYIEADLRHTDQDWLWYGERPKRGSVYYYQGRYYVLEHGDCTSSPVNADGSMNGGWNDITELVNVELKEGSRIHEEGDGNIVVNLNGDNSFNSISFELKSGATYQSIYQELRSEANTKAPQDRWAVFKTLPKGIYEIDGSYYLVPADVDLNIYMMPETPESTTLWGGKLIQYSRWIYRVDPSRLYTIADFQSGSYWWRNDEGSQPAAQNGMLYRDISTGKYYYCLFETDDKYSNSANLAPSLNTEAWMDITDWVVTK